MQPQEPDAEGSQPEQPVERRREEPRLRKQRLTRDDGRYVIFYDVPEDRDGEEG